MTQQCRCMPMQVCMLSSHFRMALHLCVLASLRLHLFVYICLLAHIFTPWERHKPHGIICSICVTVTLHGLAHCFYFIYSFKPKLKISFKCNSYSHYAHVNFSFSLLMNIAYFNPVSRPPVMPLTGPYTTNFDLFVISVKWRHWGLLTGSLVAPYQRCACIFGSLLTIMCKCYLCGMTYIIIFCLNAFFVFTCLCQINFVRLRLRLRYWIKY